MRPARKAAAGGERLDSIPAGRLYELICVAVGRRRDGENPGVRLPGRRGLAALRALGAKLERRLARAD